MPDGELPVRLAPAKATSAQFLAAYRSICLGGFPARDEMRAAARKLGFKRIRRDRTGHIGEPVDLEFYRNDKLLLSLQFGNSSLVWDGFDDGGVVDFEICKLNGHLVDGENLTADVVRSAYGTGIAFSEGSNERRLKGVVKGEAQSGWVTLRLPYLYSVDADSHVIGADRCGAFPACRVRQEARFERMLAEEGANF